MAKCIKDGKSFRVGGMPIAKPPKDTPATPAHKGVNVKIREQCEFKAKPIHSSSRTRQVEKVYTNIHFYYTFTQKCRESVEKV